MKSEIMARACAGSGGVFGLRSKDCGCLGMLGGVARRFSSRKSQARATLPTPIAFRARKRRRDQSIGIGGIGPPAESGNKFMQQRLSKEWTNPVLRYIQWKTTKQRKATRRRKKNRKRAVLLPCEGG